MAYPDPKNVTSPQTRLSHLRPVLDTEEWGYSLALMQWDREFRVGIRWNGGSDDKGKTHPGNPQSRGLSTWFIVPEEFSLGVLKIARQVGLGGGSIIKVEAEEAVQHAIEKLESILDAQKQPLSDNQLEARIIEVIKKLRVVGEL